MVQAHWFEVAIMVLIVANALLMATTHYGEVRAPRRDVARGRGPAGTMP